jgi:hypothetical protein
MVIVRAVDYSLDHLQKLGFEKLVLAYWEREKKESIAS